MPEPEYGRDAVDADAGLSDSAEIHHAGEFSDADVVSSEPIERDDAAAGSGTAVVVTLSDSAFGEDVSRITAQLEESGLAVEQVLDFIGQIVGTTTTDDLGPLMAIDGVEDVEVSQTVQLPPPDSPIQ